eukprot:1004962-Pleurochrysis_carterae.AAC.9
MLTCVGVHVSAAKREMRLAPWYRGGDQRPKERLQENRDRRRVWGRERRGERGEIGRRRRRRGGEEEGAGEGVRSFGS